MKLLWTALILMTVLVVPGRSQNSPAIPRKLVASIGGFLGASSRIELAEDGTVTYVHNSRSFTTAPGSGSVHLRIPAERWLAFRQHLDSAKVWSWNRQYRNPNILDGTLWRLEVAYADREIVSEGANAYPPGKQFDEFQAAIQELIGGKPF